MLAKSIFKNQDSHLQILKDTQKAADRQKIPLNMIDPAQDKLEFPD
jgi:hypothetical protein